MDNSGNSSSGRTHPSAGRDSVPALEVPLSNLQYQEDEMLSWLQYPLEDSFDKNYCSEEVYIEAPTSHSNLVRDAFSNLTLKEGERLHSIGLRPQTSLPSDLKMRSAGKAHMASHTWEVAAAYDTNRGERVLAADTAMAIGAHRAAGLLFQSGAETFNRVRTNAQPHLAKRAENALTTQETGKSACNLVPHTFKGRDEKYGFQPPVHRLISPNFPLFSRAVCSLQQDRLGFGAQVKGRDSASKGEQKASVASPTLHAHPTPATPESSSEAFGAPVSTKGFPQSSATRMTGMGSPRVPFQCKLQQSIAHSKDAVLTPHIDSTKTGAEAVRMTSIEETSRASRTQCTKEGLPSFSAIASTGLASGSLVGFKGAIETRGLHLIPIKRKPCSGAKSTVTTDVKLSMRSELACHDSERSQNIQGRGVAFPLNRSELGAGEEFDSSSGPVIAISGLTNSEPKVWDTVESGDITMASPSGDSSERSIKESAGATMKRKAHPPEDIEIESKDFRDGKFSQGAKRTRAAEIHNLSERKRRNKINVKMKTLQDLIPNANKTDKASVLDEAIEYMKLLQSQVQLMSLRTGMAGLPVMPSAPMQQRLQPPHLNLDLGAGLGFRMGMDAFGNPLSASPYNASGLQLVSSNAGVQEAHGHLQSLRPNEAYMLLPAQLQQQHLHSNMHTNMDMFGAYTIQQEQKVSQLQLPARETSSDDMQ